MMNISKETETPPTHEACNMTDALEHNLPTIAVAVHVINFLFGLPTHSYILWLIITGRGIASDFFTLNISICEITFSLRSLTAVTVNTFPRLWDIMMFLTGFVTTGRFFQCLICIERYLAVVHPVTFLKFKPLRYRVACSSVTWIAILISCAFCLQFVNPCLTRIHVCLYMSQFFLFLCINLFCCLAVLRALKQSGPGERGRERVEENQIKRRAFYLILINVVTLVITYVPSLIIALQYILSLQIAQELDSISHICFVLAGFVQPILYIHRVGKLPFCTSP
ncbi:C-C chemokine receptor 1-like protein 1 [Myxocyprinus asiaticus]|uniref:C-C chemokine receptor 1-like protein 1 n=1 Tax=Myxocyprinus asiaticus TaxID=70543 RepID=UPI0022221498|nr:C-C chemokine receptor 1-like protein 1 [Myxocyprinus asiaticus]